VIAVLLASLAFAGPATEPPACAVTRPQLASGRYGSRRFWTILPTDGVIRARQGTDGSLGWKLPWIPDRWRGGLTVRARRLDGPGSMRVHSVNWGYSSTGKGSWATAVTFSVAGCYRITGRSAGTTLSYVVKVVPA